MDNPLSNPPLILTYTPAHIERAKEKNHSSSYYSHKWDFLYEMISIFYIISLHFTWFLKWKYWFFRYTQFFTPACLFVVVVLVFPFWRIVNKKKIGLQNILFLIHIILKYKLIFFYLRNKEGKAGKQNEQKKVY